ncbi:hypothetical protein [Paenirhodobacter populi]|uniref:hypothetical protein n=1 Tax=Paenirhodobacter populi TaxID=2306993 RepID=UPI0013E3F817|nr:hypothetical protein [Sinirhodobacter populi]
MNFWVPVIFGLFKIGVLVTVIFLSIKSHRDGEKEEKERKKPADNMQQPSTPLMPRSLN